ncbi:MAG: M42 family metallopeptidase [Candidatus Bathyarchaeota archaeon]|nr:M42 family metallopeptidase [Candidatus Bathyarchaeota archaeon]
MSLVENLEKLSNACGVAGREGEVRSLMVNLLKPYADEVVLDRLENVIAIKKGSKDKPKVMFAAHMDEVGLMVKNITKDGFVKFAKMGGIDDRILLAQKVKVLTEKAALPGVVGSKPIHIQKEDERKKITHYDEMFLDIGAKDRDEAKAMDVKVGDPVAFDAQFVKLNDNVVMGKAFDNRAGCAVMVEVLKCLEQTDCTVYAVGTIQEELGLRGAATATFGVDPDVGIALDVTVAGDTPGVREFDTGVKMGKGPTLTVSDSGLITHPKVLRWLIDTAAENEINYQLETGLPGTTDAARMSLSRQGVPSGAISVPARYIHSPLGLVNLQDVENAAKLATRAVQKIQNRF